MMEAIFQVVAFSAIGLSLSGSFVVIGFCAGQMYERARLQGEVGTHQETEEIKW